MACQCTTSASLKAPQTQLGLVPGLVHGIRVQELSWRHVRQSQWLGLGFCKAVMSTLYQSWPSSSTKAAAAAAADPFWKSVPTGAFWPMLIVATAASVVESQALISGVFSIMRQVGGGVCCQRCCLTQQHMLLCKLLDTLSNVQSARMTTLSCMVYDMLGARGGVEGCLLYTCGACTLLSLSPVVLCPCRP